MSGRQGASDSTSNESQESAKPTESTDAKQKTGFGSQFAAQSSRETEETTTNTNKKLPWQQQSTANTDESTPVASQSAAKQTKSESSNSNLPWQQQSAGQKESPIETATKEQTLKRVIIDPVTGLYVETTLSLDKLKENNKMSFENRQEDMLEWAFWDLEGRIGLTVDKDSYNGSLTWEQEGDKLDFKFRGPLGFGGVRIHGDLGEEVRVKTTRGEEFFLQDVEQDMRANLGWSMPINSLRYWVLGITDPEQDAEVVLNDDELLDELMQGDWKVVYSSYKDVDGVMLPRKFNITGPKTKIRMIVNEWSIPDAD